MTASPSSSLVVLEAALDLGRLSDGELDAAIGAETSGLIVGWRHTLDAGWRLGQLLAEKKRRLPYGSWLGYVAQDLPIAERQARYLMDLGAADRQFIADLPAGTTVTEAVKAWTQAQRTPRPLPPGRSLPDPSISPLVRYMIDVSSAQVITEILRVVFPDAKDAVDMTYGGGQFWDGTAHISDHVVAHDLDPQRAPHGVMDCCDMQYGDKSFDVALFDPPHLDSVGEGGVMGERFGGAKDSADLRRIITTGTAEAARISYLGLIVKVTDHVHNDCYLSESEWVGDGMNWRLPYEVVHQVRLRPMIDPKWLHPQLSAYSNGSTYLIYRHGDQRHIPRSAA